MEAHFEIIDGTLWYWNNWNFKLFIKIRTSVRLHCKAICPFK